MLTIEADIFKGIELDQEASERFDKTPHYKLLNDMLEDLSKERAAHGLSLRFYEQVEQDSRLLLMYWKNKIEIGRQLRRQTGYPAGLLPPRDVNGYEENMQLSEQVFEGPSDGRFLTATIRTPFEASFTLNEIGGHGVYVYDYTYPTVIESKIKDQEEISRDENFTIRFDRNRYVAGSPFLVSHLEHRVYYMDPENRGGQLDYKTIINCPPNRLPRAQSGEGQEFFQLF